MHDILQRILVKTFTYLFIFLFYGACITLEERKKKGKAGKPYIYDFMGRNENVSK